MYDYNCNYIIELLYRLRTIPKGLVLDQPEASPKKFVTTSFNSETSVSIVTPV